MRKHISAVRVAALVALGAGALAAQTPVVNGIASAASFAPGEIASLGYAAVFGSGLADQVYLSPDANYGTKLGPTEIFICPTQAFPGGPAQLIPAIPATTCTAARIVFASPSQVNIIVPVFAGTSGQRRYIAARIGGAIDAGTSSGSPLPTMLYPFAPSIFLAGSDCLTDVPTPKGCGIQPSYATAQQAQRGVITDTAGNLVWSGNRARLGQYYTAWLTGMATIPPGKYSQSPVQMPTLVPAYGYPRPSGGELNVTYAGPVPQYPGLYQVNFQIPLSIGEGPNGYGAWPCGNYNWELPVEIAEVDGYSGWGWSSNSVQIPLVIKNGDVPCKP
jgi:uncharacterized protein (TIGR03437 family)